MTHIQDKLSGGDLRSIGKVQEVVEEVIEDPRLFIFLFEGLVQKDPVVRSRCADAVEKISSQYPKLLQPYKKRIINDISLIDQQEVQWHVAQMFSYLETTKKEKEDIFEILNYYIQTSQSNIVIANSIQTIYELSKKEPTLKPKLEKILEKLSTTKSPAVKNKCEKIKEKLKNNQNY